MNHTSVSKESIDVLKEEKEKFGTEIRYAELCDRLRPPPLNLVNTSTSTNHIAPFYDDHGTPRTSENSSSPSKEEEEDQANDARLILNLAVMQFPDYYIIPEKRTCTPRTSKTPENWSPQARRTSSPVDECVRGDKTPKDFLIQRYKGYSPCTNDFVV